MKAAVFSQNLVYEDLVNYFCNILINKNGNMHSGKLYKALVFSHKLLSDVISNMFFYV